MYFIRKKVRKSGNISYQRVRSYRNEEGKPRQQVLDNRLRMEGEYTLKASADGRESGSGEPFRVLPDINLAQYNWDLQGTVQVGQVDDGMEIS